MSQLIHGRKRDGVWRYRIWSTVVDQYVSGELTEAQLRNEVPDALYLAARLERVRSNGTSAIFDREPHDLAGPWHTERCDACSTFHHEYKASQSGTCTRCGEPENDRSHIPQAICLARIGASR